MNYLRFPDESAWTSAATEAGFLIDDTLAAYTHDRAIDVIGTITRSDETVLNGFHVNFIGKLPNGWDKFLVTPANPYRVFA
jgi:hypothetical protein